MNDDNLLARVEAWREAAGRGQPPPPAELRAAIGQARQRLQALAAALGPAGPHSSPRPADPARLAAFERAVAVCLELGQLGLELTRTWGPDYLFDLPEAGREP